MPAAVCQSRSPGVFMETALITATASAIMAAQDMHTTRMKKGWKFMLSMIALNVRPRDAKHQSCISSMTSKLLNHPFVAGSSPSLSKPTKCITSICGAMITVKTNMHWELN